MEENTNTVPAAEQVASTAQQPKVEDKPIDTGAEDTLSTMATFILIFGIIATLICAFTLCRIRNPRYEYIDEYMFNPAGFATTIEVLAGSIVSWATLKVIANISISLKEINKKLK